MNSRKGRPRGPKGDPTKARQLHADGVPISGIASALNVSKRTIARYLNDQQDGEELEDQLRRGNLGGAHAEIPIPPINESESNEETPSDESQIDNSFSIDQLLAWGVPADEAPFILVSLDSARWRDQQHVLRFWEFALGYLKEDSSTPWDVCIDLALAIMSNQALGDLGEKALVELLWRYKPWRGRQNARAYIEIVRSGVWASKPQSTPEETGEAAILKFTARDLYTLARLPRRLINNYVEKPLGFPLSLLLRGRREPPIKSSEALQIAEHISGAEKDSNGGTDARNTETITDRSE